MADGEVKIDVTVDDGDAEKTLKNLGEEAEDAGDKIEEAGEKLEDLGDSSEKSGKGFDVAKVAIGNFIANGVTQLVGKVGEAISSLIALADETREYREDMAKLDTAFKTAGHSTETAQKAYDDFYKLLGESDRSVEAVNHLAELTTNTEELAQWQTIAAGVTAKFGDSLPLEGLTEAANETAKVGAVTGPFADALNWASAESGVFSEALGGNDKALQAFNKAVKDGENVEDAFSAALAEMSTEQERSSAITATLTGLYAEAGAEYNELTADAQAARDATNQMEQAQARLGEAIEPLTTGMTTLKAELLDLGANVLGSVISSFTSTKDVMLALNDEQVRMIEASLSASERLQALKTAADESAIGISTSFNYTASLANELLALADATGRVEEADRARAEFIIGELNEALGTEYAMTGNIIQNYGDIEKNIYKVIEAKKAQIILAEYEEAYAAAVKNVASQEQARADAAIEAGARLADFEAAKLAEKEARIAYEQAVEDDANYQYIQRLGNELTALETNTRNKEMLLGEAQEKYNETAVAVDKSYDAINSYEEASTLILQGETGKAISLLNNYGNGFTQAAGKVDKANAQEIESLKNKVINTQVQLGLLEAEYKQNQGSMTDAQKKEMEKRIAAAKKEAQDALKEANTIGGNLIEGIKQGANGKEWTLTGALKSIVGRALQAAKDAAGIKSPARVFRDEVGEMISLGMALGIDDEKATVIKAAEGVVNGIRDVIGKAKKENDKTVQGYRQQYRDEQKAHSDEIARLNKDTAEKLAEIDKKYKEDKATKNAELLKLDTDHVEKAAELDKKYAENKANKNEELKKLDADYADDKAKLDKKLAEDKKKKNANYTKLNSDYNDKIKELNKKYNENKAKKTKELEKIESGYVDDKAQLDKKLVEDKAKKNTELVKLDEKRMTDIAEAYKKGGKQVEDARKKHNETLLKIEDNINKAITGKMEELTALGDKYKDEAKKLWEDLEKSITDLQANYDNQLASRTKSIADSMDLWSEATQNRPTVAALMNNLNSQVNLLERYNEAIDALSERNINPQLLQEIKEMGVDATGEIQTLVRMSDKNLEKYVALWEEKQRLANEAALEELEPLKAETEQKIVELTDAALTKYDEMRAKFTEEGKLLAEETRQAMIDAENGMYEELISEVDAFTEAGANLMDGIIFGIIEQSPLLADAVTSAVSGAIEAAKTEAGIASPSKVMKKEVGHNLADGLMVGWTDKIGAIKNKMAADMQGLTARIKTAVTLENARMSQGVGVRDTGFTDIAQAVGMQTAGINSLASEFRHGSKTQLTVPIVLGGRELGRAIVELGNTENARIGSTLVKA